MEEYQLAQINIARALAPMDSPVMADFVNNLDRINALAEQSEGFVWRLQDENNNATAIQAFEDDFIIVNMSVWTSMEDLFNFTYKSDHVAIFTRRKEWFSAMQEMHMAFWYIKKGTIPTVAEAKLRLSYLNTHGETPYAFTFKGRFTPEDLRDYTPQTLNS